ncbi:MAG: RluA family pseudouridine synthase [Pseudomonadota bacterium]
MQPTNERARDAASVRDAETRPDGEALDRDGDPATCITIIIDAAADRTRLDKALAQEPALEAAALTRARLQGLIRGGNVIGPNGPVRDPAAKVRSGTPFAVHVPAAVDADPQPEPLALSILHEDDALIVIDKPVGMVVHPAPGHETGTVVNALLAHCGASLSGIGGVKRPGIVHRLDQMTSGLLVIAKSDVAHQGLSAQFKAHGRDGRLQRSYEALVWGALTPQRGTIDAPIGRSRQNRKKMAVREGDDARVAITHYETHALYKAGIDGSADGVGNASHPLTISHLRCHLETGRTHQIRVHLTHAGHPVLGDPLYGRGHLASARGFNAAQAAAFAALQGQALHAGTLGFEHPMTGEALLFEAPRPPAFQAMVNALQTR